MSAEELTILNCGTGEHSWESFGLQDQTSQSWRRSALNIHWKHWSWSWDSTLWLSDGKNSLTGKDPDAGQDWRQEEKGMTEDEIVGWHHWFYGHEFEQALGIGDGQGSLEYWNPCGSKELNWVTELNCYSKYCFAWVVMTFHWHTPNSCRSSFLLLRTPLSVAEVNFPVLNHRGDFPRMFSMFSVNICCIYVYILYIYIYSDLNWGK